MDKRACGLHGQSWNCFQAHKRQESHQEWIYQHGFTEETLYLTNSITSYDEVTSLADERRAEDIVYLDFRKADNSLLHDPH